MVWGGYGRYGVGMGVVKGIGNLTPHWISETSRKKINKDVIRSIFKINGRFFACRHIFMR